MYRGDVVPKDVNAAVHSIKTKRTVQFVDWYVPSTLRDFVRLLSPDVGIEQRHDSVFSVLALLPRAGVPLASSAG
jgi:hypothetical protein